MAQLTEFRVIDRCPRCGVEGEVRTCGRVGGEGATYGVGDEVAADVTPERIRAAAFVAREPMAGEPLHVLMPWSCNACGGESCVEIVFDRGLVAAIRPVELTVAVLDRSHYVEETLGARIEACTNHSMWDEWGVWPAWVRALRENLARQEGVPDPIPLDDSPLGATLDGGRYRIEAHYLGGGADQLWFARSDARPGVRYLVSVAPDNGLKVAVDGPGLLQAADGLFPPRFLGDLDLAGLDAVEALRWSGLCAYVEELPAGAPLRTLGIDLRRHAVGLGAQVGALLERASASGVLDIGLRPEYVWATFDGEVPTIRGVGGRSALFFAAASRRRDLPTARLFTHRYLAPEVARGEPYDDRALVFTLAVMIAEWLVGEYPYAQDDGAWGYYHLCDGEHVAIPAVSAVADLLGSALRPIAGPRPDLASFTQALARLARS